jgi:hypothetical protein
MHYEMSIRSGGQGLCESILEYFLSATIAPIWILCVSRLECYRVQEDQGETRISQPESAVLRSPGPRLLI